jgi:hypothetical protein
MDDRDSIPDRGSGFSFASASRLALGPVQPPILWVREDLTMGLKRPGREADYSSPSNAKVTNVWSYTSTPYTKVYPKAPGLAAWSENCKCYSSVPTGAAVSLFCESV